MIGHVSPEAYDGGPIALVEDGDSIAINTQHRTLNLVSSVSLPAYPSPYLRTPLSPSVPLSPSLPPSPDLRTPLSLPPYTPLPS